MRRLVQRRALRPSRQRVATPKRTSARAGPRLRCLLQIAAPHAPEWQRDLVPGRTCLRCASALTHIDARESPRRHVNGSSQRRASHGTRSRSAKAQRVQFREAQRGDAQEPGIRMRCRVLLMDRSEEACASVSSSWESC
jgi:hypothetical protein